jgi:hypothetical protein
MNRRQVLNLLGPATPQPLARDAAVWPVELQRNDLFRMRGRAADAARARGDFASLKQIVSENASVADTLIRAYQYVVARFDCDRFRIARNARKLLAVCAVLVTTAGTISAQQPRPVLSHATWSKGCETSVVPSVTFGPDNRVVSFILPGFSASPKAAAGKAKAKQSLQCRLGVEVKVPEDSRVSLRAAQYGLEVFLSGSATAEVQIRHGVKRLWTRWSKPVVVNEAHSGTTILAPPGSSPRSGCGGSAQFVIELTATATISEPGAGSLAAVDSVDFDAQLQDQLFIEPC